MMIEVYELGKSLNIKYSLKIDEKLKFSQFPYTGSDIVNTSAFFLLGFVFFAIFAEYIFNAEILFTTFTFFGFILAATLYIYPTQIYYLGKIMEYKKEMLNTIMRFSMYLSMKSNFEFALHNSLDHIKGILKVQFNEILLKLERKEYLSLGEAFKDYSLIWNQYSPEFVDSLKLLEVASLSSEKEAQQIMEQAVDQIILSYNIEQKRNSEVLSSKVDKIIMAGIMLPVMILMLVPLISVFMPDTIKASMLFLLFNIFIPSFLLVNGLKFSASRLQLINIKIENSKEFTPVTMKVYLISFVTFILFLIPSFIFLIKNPPSDVSFNSFNIDTIFFVWLIPAGISLATFIITSYYINKNKTLYKRYLDVEEDIPHILNYFSTYLSLNVPIENIFYEISKDYKKHGFKDHPTVGLFEKISFKLSNLKTNLKSFIAFDLDKVSSIKILNEVLEQIASFAEFSLSEAARVAKKIREQRVNIIKLNDYILTLLSGTISTVSSTMTMLCPLLSAMAIVMSLFIVTFIQFLSKQLEQIANLGAMGGNQIELQLIDIKEIISPVYLELIIGFYIVEILLILAMIKSNLEYGYNSYNVIKSIKEAQLGFVVFTLCLFGGYYLFKVMFANTIGVQF
jgi:hypothetical protein